MRQPPPYHLRPQRHQLKKKWGIGCGVLAGLFVLLWACGTLIEATKDTKSTPSKTVISPSAPTSQAAAESSPPTATVTVTVSPTSTATPTQTPTASSVDEPARRACVATVRAVALRKAGWTAKADAEDDEAFGAARDSYVPALESLIDGDSDQLPARLHRWCVKNLPDVKAKPVPKKPAPKPKPKPPEPAEPDEPKTDPRFDTCKEANAHGYQDYRKGVDPEYDWYQDRDGDGVVCEPG